MIITTNKPIVFSIQVTMFKLLNDSNMVKLDYMFLQNHQLLLQSHVV